MYMPTVSQYVQFVCINVAFLLQILMLAYFSSATDVQENWPKYRCNPSYWIFSKDLSQDFTYCVQNTQLNMMSYLLQPMTYMVSSLNSMGGNISDSVNAMRFMVGNLRDMITSAIQNVFGVFLNMIIQFQKLVINIKDSIGKMIGVVVTMMYILDGSMKTMNSAWSGPPGQMVKAIGGGSCFHPETPVQLQTGEYVAMCRLRPGQLLHSGATVLGVMHLHNHHREPYYRIRVASSSSSSSSALHRNIYVTGSHYVLLHDDNFLHQWTQVQHCSFAEKTSHIDDQLCCLLTSDGYIPLQGWVFSDWEDDHLHG